MSPRLLILCLPLATACRGKCKTLSSWDGVDIVVGEDVDEDRATRVQAAFWEFSSWSGMDQVCLDEIYAAAPRFPWTAPGFEIEWLPEWPLDLEAGWELQYAAPAGDQLVLLLEWEGTSRTSRWQVQRVEPLTGTLVSAVDFDPCGRSSTCRVAYLGAGEQAIWLEIWKDLGSFQLRVDTKGGLEWTPGMWCLHWDGEVLDDDYYVQLMKTGMHSAAIQTCSLSTGELISDEALPEPPFPQLSRYRTDGITPSITRRLDRLALEWPEAGLSWMDEEGAWQGISLPWYLSITRLLPLGAGAWLVQLDASSHVDGQRIELVAGITAEGALVVPEDPCGVAEIWADPDRGEPIVGDDWVVLMGETDFRPARIHGLQP